MRSCGAYYLLIFPVIPRDMIASDAVADELRVLRAVQLRGTTFLVCSMLSADEMWSRLLAVRAHVDVILLRIDQWDAYGCQAEPAPSDFDLGREKPVVVRPDSDEEAIWMIDIERYKRALAGKEAPLAPPAFSDGWWRRRAMK